MSNSVQPGLSFKTYFNWSTGKDSALALHYMKQDASFDVSHLLTAVNSHYDRISMHGLRRALFEKQVQALGIPHSTIELPEQPSMEEYEQIMEASILPLIDEGYTHSVFGDIFLEDLRQYRENQLASLKLTGHFPLWKRNTNELMEEFLDLDFKAIVVCINGTLLDESFVGRELDHNFIRDLPKGVDPCGENGEFHTFCYDGPIFQNPIAFNIGSKTQRSYPAPGRDQDPINFWFCDLLPT